MPVPTTVSEPEDTGQEEALDDPDDDPAHGLGSLAHHLVDVGVVAAQKEGHVLVRKTEIFGLSQNLDPVLDVTDEQVPVTGKARQEAPDSHRLLRLEVL